MADKKSNKVLFIGISAAFVILAVLYFLALPAPEIMPPADTAAQTTGGASVTEETAATEEAVETDETAPEETAEIADDSGFDMAAIKAERILGNPQAPIKIGEYASLTCSHCAHFHKDSLDKVKTELIDTGKAYLVYSDFPLNAPALHASMVARCLPQEEFFPFIDKLFLNQEDWAFDTNYLEYLKTAAAEHGLPEDRFQACLQSKAIQELILNRMRAAQKMWQINSTPSFIVNNRTVLGGALSPDEFVKAVTEAANAPTAAPADDAAPQPEGGE